MRDGNYRTQSTGADADALVAQVFRIQACKFQLVRRIVRPLVGYRHYGLIIVSDDISSLVQLDYVALVCGAHILDVLVDRLPNVGLDVLYDLRGAQGFVHHSLDQGQMIVVLEQLTEVFV